MGVANYSRGHGYASHDRVLAALGLEDKSSLTRPDDFTYAAKDGGDPFQALFALFEDFRDLIIPVLESSEEGFYEAIDDAVREFQDRL